jgi:hypothetical protein
MNLETGRVKMAWKRMTFVTCMMAVALSWGGFAGEAGAVEVAGVSLADSVLVGAQDQALLLNGAGVRKKVFVKVYVGALYLQQKKSEPQAILDDAGPKRMVMHFLYKEVGAKKLADAWSEGFHGNQGAEEMRGLKERLEQFNALFPTVHRGDRIEIDLLPDRGTVVRLNGKELGSVAGADFARALLEVWLGAKPADKGLKKALLGK